MHRLIKSKLKLFLKGSIGWSGDHPSWQAALQKCSGYDANNILQKVKDATLKVKNGEAVYERDSVIFNEIEYSWPLLAILLWVAARNKGKLSVVDLGGSLGSTYFQNKQFLKGLNEVHWNIVEQPDFVNCGKKYIQDDILKFYPSVPDALSEHRAGLIIISCTLPYIDDPYKLIGEIIHLNIPVIIIDNTPFNFEDRDRLTVQKVPPSIYTASYPCWFLNYNKVKQAFAEQYRIVSEHLNDSVIELDGRKIRYQGLLLERKLPS